MFVASVGGARMGLLAVCLLAAVGQSVLALELGQSCTNPNGESGLCVLFRDCPPLVEIFNKPINTPDEAQFLEDSRCGTIGRKALVCCVREVWPTPPNCGIQLGDRIFGGQPTAIDEFPWAVLIEYERASRRFGFHCGGSLINERYVLTAAHCIKSIHPTWKVHRVRLGEWDLSSDRDCNDFGACNDAPIDMDIEKIIVHADADIALIRMARNVEYSESVRPICLPLSNVAFNNNHVGSSSLVAGWGKTENGTVSPKKLKVELTVKSLQECSWVYQRIGTSLKSTELCAGGMKGKDTCSGDSGGPLMRQFAGAWYQIGIVSFGPSKCGTADIPGVYTDVAKFDDWIRANVY